MVRNFQRVIGDEARRQILEKEGRLPDLLVACVGGGSNALGLFYPFLETRRWGWWALRREARDQPGKHAARFQGGSLGVFRGPARTCCRMSSARSGSLTVSAPGWIMPRWGPEHAWLRDKQRVQYTYATDESAGGVHPLARLEGIIPALESSHAVAEAIRRAPGLGRDHILIINLAAGETRTWRRWLKR